MTKKRDKENLYMRCFMCDFCDGEAKSIYNFSVIDTRGSKRRKVSYNRELDREVCNYCLEFIPNKTPSAWVK